MTFIRLPSSNSANHELHLAYQRCTEKIMGAMTSLGYKLDGGFCHGYAALFLQAILSDQLKEVEYLIKIINDTEDLSTRIKEAQQNVVNAKIKSQTPSPQDMDFINILALFDIIMINQSPNAHKDWFGRQDAIQQEIMTSLNLTAPDKLREFKHDDHHHLTCISHHGIYTYDELVKYFGKLQDILDTAYKIDSSLNTPFTLFFSTGAHAVSVSYSYAEKKWIYADSNFFPIMYLKNKHDIADMLFSRLPFNNILPISINSTLLGLSTQVVYSKNASSSLIQCINDWTTSSEVLAGLKMETKMNLLNSATIDDQYRIRILQPMITAIKFDLFDMFKLLMQNGFMIDMKPHNDGLLLRAVDDDRNQFIDELLYNFADPNLSNSDNYTPLHHAVLKNNIEAVKILLNYHANIECKTIANNEMPLHYAVEKNSMEITQLLLNHGADPNARGTQQATPLIFAANNNASDMIALLIKHHADPNIQIADGVTPLFLAAQNGHFLAVEMLLKNGADISLSFQTTSDRLRKFTTDVEINKKIEAFITSKNHEKSSENIELTMTPYDIALITGHDEIANLIKLHADMLAKQRLRFFSDKKLENYTYIRDSKTFTMTPNML